MIHNSDMIKMLRLLEGKQEFAGEEVGQKPGDQVRGTDKAKTGGKDHPFKGRLVGEDTTLEDVLSKKYQDFKDLQAKEKEEKKKEKEDLDEQGVAEGSKDSAPKMSKQERKLAQSALKGAKDMSATLGLVRDKDGVLRMPKNKEQGVAEGSIEEVSLGDYVRKAGMQKAQAGMGAMFAPTADQRAQELAKFKKRERGLERVKARSERARKADQERHLADLVARLPKLKAEYEEMRKQYKALGGSDWQYADREQNLTDAERRARSMEGPMNNLWREIQAAEKAQKDRDIEEAFIAPGLSAANAAAEFKRQGQAGGGYKGRIDIPVSSVEDYQEAGRTLKRAAAAKKQHIEYGLSGRTMSVFSDSMDTDELDAFIDDALTGGLDEGYLDRTGEEHSPVTQAITRRILLQRTDLLAKYGPEKVAAAIDDVADFVGDVDEIGSSDVSGWVRHVEQLLGNDVEEAAPPLVRAAAGLGMGALSGTGGVMIGSMLGGIFAPILGGYSGYQGAKLGMQTADEIWDWVAKKFGGEQKAETFAVAHARAAVAGQPTFDFGGKTFKTTIKPEEAKPAVQAVKSVAESRRNAGTELAEVSNPTDKITVDVPLMLRIMEYAREDAQDDMDLHDITERLVELSAGGNTLSMKDYDSIVGITAEQKLSELGATPPSPPQGTATTGTAPAGNAAPTSSSISPDEQTALNKINQTPAMKQQLDKLMTQATPGGQSKPMELDPDEQDALERVKANAGLGSQYAKLIAQANPAAAKSSVAKP